MANPALAGVVTQRCRECPVRPGHGRGTAKISTKPTVGRPRRASRPSPVLAVAAQLDRDYIREKTLEGQAAAAKGNHGGRPMVIDDDMLTFAIALKNKGVPVSEIAGKGAILGAAEPVSG